MTRQTWEEERDARILARVLLVLEEVFEILKRAFPPPQYRPTTAIVVTPAAPRAPVVQHESPLSHPMPYLPPR
jgi:hypothetical protein